jgi:hypothetical protein
MLENKEINLKSIILGFDFCFFGALRNYFLRSKKLIC